MFAVSGKSWSTPTARASESASVENSLSCLMTASSSHAGSVSLISASRTAAANGAGYAHDQAQRVAALGASSRSFGLICVASCMRRRPRSIFPYAMQSASTLRDGAAAVTSASRARSASSASRSSPTRSSVATASGSATASAVDSAVGAAGITGGTGAPSCASRARATSAGQLSGSERATSVNRAIACVLSPSFTAASAARFSMRARARASCSEPARCSSSARARFTSLPVSKCAIARRCIASSCSAPPENLLAYSSKRAAALSHRPWSSSSRAE